MPHADPNISGGNAPQVASQMQNQRLAGGGAPVTSPEQLPQNNAASGMGPAVSVGDHLAEAFRLIMATGFTPEVESALEGFFLSLQQMSPGAQQQGAPQQAPQQPPMPQGQAPVQFPGGNTALNVPQAPPR